MTAHFKQRYVLLDVLRGLCVLSMIAYHAMFDVVDVLGRPVSWFWQWPGHLWQQSICWTFILLSGACWGLSHRHAKRGLLLVVCGAAVTLVTFFFLPSELILYGVLNLLGLSCLLLDLCRILCERFRISIPAGAGLAVSALLFFLTKEVPRGYLGFEGLTLCRLPQGLYRFDVLAVLGFPGPAFFSSDYFPLIPWFFLYLSGYFLWKLLSRRLSVTTFLQRDPPLLRPFAFIGRHSLLLYLLHQPVLFGLFYLFAR